MGAAELAELRRSIDILIALTLCQLEQRTDPSDIIEVLGRFGIKPSKIAAILGMTPNAVRIARHRRCRTPQKKRNQIKK
jgi:hypothetical protein